jgi:hypothetical protein
MAVLAAWPLAGLAATGEVQFAVTGADGQPLPCRIHLFNSQGKVQQAPGLPFWKTHFVCPGDVALTLPADTYQYQIERGPEHARRKGSFTLSDGGSEKIAVRLDRIADLAADGWFAGDLHVHRAVEEMKLLMRAEDLHVAPVITWWNNRNLWADRQVPEELLVHFDGNRYYRVMAGEDEREGGALMYFNLDRPLDITGSTREYPSPMQFVNQARQSEKVWIDVEKPFWWDVPVWLASGQIDSIGLANNHMCHAGVYPNEAWGRPRDEERLPPPLGNGYWTQEIYYHILNAGLRVPPSAGSASGVLPNPLGYDRVYVHTGDDFSYDRWWEGLKAGRSFVTNGPLLLVEADGHLPGHVFTAREGEKIAIDLDVSLTTLDNVPKIEIIKNGRVEKAVSPDELAKADGKVEVTFDRSGWFLVRAITDVANTFRFASTAPYYVEIGPEKKRISKASAQFFLDWIDERIERVPLKLDDPQQLQEVLGHHYTAKQVWQRIAAEANAE